ncbi:MAG TPA: hypothetical protein VNQ77_16620 [Frankiaceae bacterium]|nr:hypothetical protein [Frankiaceae bacterium]
MNRTLFAAFALLAATPAVPAPAHAAPGPNDPGCFVLGALDHPEAPEHVMSGVITGGPVTQDGTLTCTVKAGVSTHAGSYAYGVSAAADSAGGLALLPPRLVSWVAPPGEPIYLCEQFFDGNATYYWDAQTHTWTTDANARCEQGLVTGASDPLVAPLVGVVEATEAAINDFWAHTDWMFCDLFPLAQGDYGVFSVNSQGDVFLLGEPFWDCPPYDLWDDESDPPPRPRFDVVVAHRLLGTLPS